eukprot:3843292-Rhodomonas_salina.3
MLLRAQFALSGTDYRVYLYQEGELVVSSAVSDNHCTLYRGTAAPLSPYAPATRCPTELAFSAMGCPVLSARIWCYAVFSTESGMGVQGMCLER